MTNTLLGYDNAGRLNSLHHAMARASADVGYSLARNPAGQIVTEGHDNDSYAWPGHVDVSPSYAVNAQPVHRLGRDRVHV